MGAAAQARTRTSSLKARGSTVETQSDEGGVVMYEALEIISEDRVVVYEAPEIVYEGELEVQAGSPLGIPDWDESLEEW